MLTRFTVAGLAGAAAITASSLAGGVEPLATTTVVEGLRFPTYITHAPGDYKRTYILEKAGLIKVLNIRTGQVNAELFLDIDDLVIGGVDQGDERGLLGMAFHPDFRNNRYFYLYYTAPGGSGVATVARFTAPTNDVADRDSRVTLLTMQQPYSNHNGGWIDFGPNDGYLYIGTGDGGLFGDPGNRAQDITNQLLGKMLRIDVDADDRGNYGIPKSNPFVGIDGDDEIWAYGLRNPWRCAFDQATGDLFMGDVGQDRWEELNWQPADSAGGENYAWRCNEGLHTYNFSGDCSQQTFVDPIIEYGRSGGLTIVAGPTYRGCAIPSLRGHTFYADYGTRNIWSFEDNQTPDIINRRDEIGQTIENDFVARIVSFGEDAHGEMYIINHGSRSEGNGLIARVIPVTPTIDRADLNCDGTVGFGDLLIILAAFGSDCDGCQADVDWDDDVDFDDILFLLARWGD